MTIEKVEFEFPDVEVENPRKGGAIVEPEAKEPETEVVDGVEVVDDTPEQDRGREPSQKPAPADLSDEDLEKYDLSVRKRIKQVQRTYHDERRAKEAAMREKEEALRLAQAVVEENKKLKGSLSQGQQALVEQAKKVAANEMAEAEREYKTAYEAGDPDALILAQRKLNAAQLKSERLQNFKPTSLQREEKGVQQQQSDDQVAPAPAKVDPKLRDWEAKNEWFGSNKRMTAYALGLHEDLVAEGVPVGSDDYYSRIDADVRKRFPEAFDSEELEAADATTPAAKKPNVVAPATRGTAPKKIVLTKSQVAIAKRLGVPLEAYARKVAELTRN